MKKCFTVLVLLIIPVFSFSQSFDDVAYPSPDFMTYFQQEMISLVGLRIPFFASISHRSSSLKYQDKYLNDLYPGGYSYEPFEYYYDPRRKESKDTNVLFGWQIKANNTFSVPIIFYGTLAEYKSYAYFEWPHNPPYIKSSYANGFLASGLIINTDIVKGGIYLGYDARIYSSDDYYEIRIRPDITYYDDGWIGGTSVGKFKIALAPIINTSNWEYIGKAVDNVLVYLGTGDPVMYATDKVFDEGYTKFGSFANTLNAALELRFNKIHLDPFSLQATTVYSRGNYDAVSKNDVYGLKIHGYIDDFWLRFSLEGGYKHLFYVSQWFEEDYTNTGYFKGSIYFLFDNIVLV